MTGRREDIKSSFSNGQYFTNERNHYKYNGILDLRGLILFNQNYE